MSFWTPGQLNQILGGRWLTEPADLNSPLAGLSIDSRAIAPGQVFLAIKGEKFDGHDYLSQTFTQGAAMAIVQAVPKNTTATPGSGILLVPDTIAALQKLAGAYRDHLRTKNIKVITVAGSNGKTTTRNLIHSVLSSQLQGTQSPKSFNNHLGVPLTLLGAGLNPQDQFVVVEAGTNHPGELAQLGAIIRPDALVITNIGHEHMEFFGSLTGVAVEEASILSYLSPQGLAVLPGDESGTWLAPHLPAFPSGVRTVRFGRGPDCDLRLLDSQSTTQGQRFTVRLGNNPPTIAELSLPLAGPHNAINALAAVAIAQWMGLDQSSIATALSQVTGVPMRLEIRSLPTASGSAPLTLINDAYNANPDSVLAALHTLAQSPAAPGSTPENTSPSRRVAILGDMLELGAQAPDLHRMVGKQAAELAQQGKLDLVILIGRLSMFTAEALSRSKQPGLTQVFPQWDDALPAKVASLLRPGDRVLLKASRSMGLERLIPAIEQACTQL